MLEARKQWRGRVIGNNFDMSAFDCHCRCNCGRPCIIHNPPECTYDEEEEAYLQDARLEDEEEQGK